MLENPEPLSRLLPGVEPVPSRESSPWQRSRTLTIAEATARRKTGAVLRLLRGEDLELLSRELGVADAGRPTAGSQDKVRYSLSSRSLSGQRFGEAVRSHCGIESGPAHIHLLEIKGFLQKTLIKIGF